MILLAACAFLAGQPTFANTHPRTIEARRTTPESIAVAPTDLPVQEESIRQRIRVKNLRTHARLVNGKIIIDSFSGTFAGGAVRSNGPLNLADARGLSAVNVQFNDVRIEELGRQLGFEFPASVTGRISGTASLRWQGNSATDVRKTLSGRMSVTLQNGEIAGVDGLSRLAQFSGVKELESLKFGFGRLELTADHGRLKISSAEATGTVQSVSARGDLDLASGKVAARIALALSQKAAAHSTNEYVRQLGAATEARPNAYVDMKLPVLISGTLAKPQAAVDYSSLDVAQALALTGSHLQGANASSPTRPGRAAGEPTWVGTFRGILGQ